MTCTCTLDPTLQSLLAKASYAPWLAVFLVLLWAGNRMTRREYFVGPSRQPLGKALALNAGAILCHLAALGILARLLLMGA